MDTIMMAALLVATTTGAGLASVSQPACHWSSLGAIVLKTRLAMLKAVAPSRRRARLAALGLTMLVCAGGLTAYAAQPSAPERLASQAAGVVGSGDQLALRVVQEGRERTLKPGDDYAEGWKLDALTPTSATLIKGDERREVGLNATGAVASKAPAAPPSRVDIAGEDARLLAQAIARGVWDGQKLQPGLTLEETRRYWVLNERFSETYRVFQTDLKARAEKAGVTLSGAIFRNDELSALGPQYAPEFASLSNKMADARDQQYADTYARYGPVTLHFASEAERVAGTASYGQAAWIRSNQAADGSFDMTLSGPNTNTATRYSMEVAANPPPLDSIQILATTTPGSNTFSMMPQPPR